MALRLIQLKLNNFRQFTDHTFNLDGDTVCIIGPNGSGKTNTLEAIYFALTGEIRTGAKADCLTETCGNKQASKGYVELDFKFNDTLGTIKRSIHTSASSLQFGDLKLTKANEINDFMTNLVGVTKKTLSKYCCVAQGETEAIVSDQPAARADAFSELFGSHHCKRLYDTLGKEENGIQLTDYQAIVTHTQDNITDIQQRLKTITDKLTELSQQLSIIDKKQYETIKQDYLAAKAVEETRSRLDQQLTEITNNIDENLRQIETVRAAVKCAQDELAVGLSAYREAQEFLRISQTVTATRHLLLASNNRHTELSNKLEQIELALAELVEPKPEFNAEKIKTLSAEIYNAKLTIDGYKAFMVDGGKLSCPTCGQEIKDQGEQLAKANKLYGELLPVYNKLIAMQAEYEADRTKYDKQLSAYSTQKELLCAELIKLDAEILKYSEILSDSKLDPKKDTATEQAIVDTYSRLLVDLEVNQNKLTLLERQATVLDSQLDAAITHADLLDQKCLQAPSEDKYREALQMLLALDSLTSEFNLNSGLKAGCEKELATAEASLVKYNKLLAESEQAKKYKQLLQDARAVMHRDNLPRVRSQQYMESINDKLQHYLTKFDSKFTATLKSDYEFSCIFSDGKVQPSSRLSGGEKVRLSLAFRFAINELFAKNLGFLILDEPTVYLDDSNIQYLGEIIDHMKITAKSAGMQILVVTHEQELRGHFDRAIMLGVS